MADEKNKQSAKVEARPAEEFINDSSPNASVKKPAASAAANVEGYIDRLGRMIPDEVEDQLANLPPTAFLGLAALSLGLSATLAFTQERKGWATFIGTWVPTLLCLGMYAKLNRFEARPPERGPTVH